MTPWVLEDACASNAARHPAQQVHDSAILLMSRLVGAGHIIDTTRALANAYSPATHWPSLTACTVRPDRTTACTPASPNAVRLVVWW